MGSKPGGPHQTMSLKILTSLGDLFLRPGPQSQAQQSPSASRERNISGKAGSQILAVVWSMLATCQLLEAGMLITLDRIEDLNQL